MLQLSLTYKASYKTCLARGNYDSFHGAKGYRDLQDKATWTPVRTPPAWTPRKF